MEIHLPLCGAEKDDDEKGKLVPNRLHAKKSVMEIQLTSYVGDREDW